MRDYRSICQEMTGQMISVEKIGVESSIGFSSVCNMEISIKPNQHVKLVLQGILNPQTVQDQPDWDNSEIKVIMQDENGNGTTILFHGIINESYVYHESGEAQAIVTALSGSSILDRKKVCRSFQNIQLTYGSIIQKKVGDAGGSVRLPATDTACIQRPVIQYEETDWELCKRMASHMGTILYCNPAVLEPSLQAGINAEDKAAAIMGQEYKAYAGAVLPNGETGICYEMQCCENYKVGSMAESPFGKLCIYEKNIFFNSGELYFTYRLCYPRDIHMDTIYNPKIQGLMLEGEVTDTKEETVYVRFDIDGKDGEALFPYQWTPVSGNIMYCMPEKGTKVKVYFGSKNGREAWAVAGLRQNGNNPVTGKRTLQSPNGKQVQLYPEQLSLKGKAQPGKKLSIELTDNRSISLQSNTVLALYSNNGIRLNAPYITVTTPTELHVCRTSLDMMRDKLNKSGSKNPATGGECNIDDSILTMGQEFNLLSQQGILQGTEYIRYNAFQDAPEEAEVSENTFSMWKWAGCILAGVAVVAAVALIAAYAASVVFSGGAMLAAAPIIVAGVVSLVGGAVVAAKAASDYDNQTNSSPLEYMGYALLGAAAGAVAGFAIAAAPYTAQMLAQQALLMLPGAVVNPLTVSIVSGGAMLVTEGITFSNLVFTHYNMVELVSGENVLKDWMTACNEANGENTYNILSGASFIASMGIMFMGVDYMNAMRQVSSGNEGGRRTVNGFDTTVSAGKQGKHIVGNNNFIEGRSIFNGTVDDAQRLVDNFAGTGEWIGTNKERVNFGEVIGQYVNPATNEAVDTTVGIIHYSKTGTHIVPAQPIQ